MSSICNSLAVAVAVLFLLVLAVRGADAQLADDGDDDASAASFSSTSCSFFSVRFNGMPDTVLVVLVARRADFAAGARVGMEGRLPSSTMVGSSALRLVPYGLIP